MPPREILTSSDRMQLLAFPEDEAELIRRYTLTKADLAFVRQQKRVAERAMSRIVEGKKRHRRHGKRRSE